VTQTRGSGAQFEALLPPQRQLMVEQQPQPFGVFEAAGLQ
jgi:hypothetical protein